MDDLDAHALAALVPEGPLADAVADGWAALQRGEWQQARTVFEAALAREDTPAAWEGLIS
jgi:uncharacterized protein HemY